MVTDLAKTPIFLVGAMRSGTTLLRLMLDHHPEICLFGEFEYAVRWIDDRGPPPLDEYLHNLELDRVFKTHGFHIDRGLTYSGLVKSFLHQAIDRSGKPYGGATIHSNFHQLPMIWDNAKYIHIVRDPRDVSRSCIGMGWVGNVWYGTKYWLEPVEKWSQLRARLRSDQRYELRYEELVTNPEKELRGICDFLQLSFDPAMLTYPEHTTYSAPDASLAEQWRKKMTPREIQWVESVCNGRMEDYGYEPSHSNPAGPSLVEALRLMVQNRTSRVERNVRKYGLKLYLGWQVAKRFDHSPWGKRILQRVNEVQQSKLK